MKKGIVLLIFFLVAFSLAAHIVADSFLYTIELKIVEKEESGKEADNEKDLDKEKIVTTTPTHLNFINALPNKYFHSEDNIFSSFLDTDIIPPDNILA